MTEIRKPFPLGRASSEWYDHDAFYGSRNLLAAQLSSGQHSLGKEAFWERVRELRERGVRL